MKTILIAAIGNQNQLGKDNKLLWNIPEDLAHFKAITSGSPIIMGRKTFESLPGVLPNRMHIVISNQKTHKFNNKYCDASFENLKYGLNYLQNSNINKAFIIGGGQIYKQALEENLVNEMYISHVDYNGEADTYFPKIKEEDWKKTLVSTHSSTETEPAWDLYHYYKRK